MQPPATSSCTRIGHEDSTDEVGERQSASENDSEGTPAPAAARVACERVGALTLNGDLRAAARLDDGETSAAAASPSRLEQLSARVSLLEAELASRQRQFDEERAIWSLEKQKVP